MEEESKAAVLPRNVAQRKITPALKAVLKRR
jgi:hypothetical protein